LSVLTIHGSCWPRSISVWVSQIRDVTSWRRGSISPGITVTVHSIVRRRRQIKQCHRNSRPRTACAPCRISSASARSAISTRRVSRVTRSGLRLAKPSRKRRGNSCAIGVGKSVGWTKELSDVPTIHQRVRGLMGTLSLCSPYETLTSVILPGGQITSDFQKSCQAPETKNIPLSFRPKSAA
jgi:hypothetical protein